VEHPISPVSAANVRGSFGNGRLGGEAAASDSAMDEREQGVVTTGYTENCSSR
jgi:hypothetical protein